MVIHYPRGTLYRPNVQRELYKGLDEYKNVSLLFGKKIVDMNHGTAAVTTEEGTAVEADLVIAADAL